MMDLLPAFLLGLLGSLHCAGMCGPLALALPATSHSRWQFFCGRIAYNSGRVLTDVVLGAVFGLLGGALAVAGLQRWLSLAAGAAILVGVALSSRVAFAAPAVWAVGWIKAGLGRLLQRRSGVSLLALGSLNGLLPCGLVYVAGAGAMAAASLAGGMAYMAVFGLGTVPMMLGLSVVGRGLPPAVRFQLQRFVPVALVFVGALLILRGLALGIPGLSPGPDAAALGSLRCH
jgi:hypothetical protein